MANPRGLTKERLEQYEFLRLQFRTIKYLKTKSKYGGKFRKVVSTPSMDKFLRMENEKREPKCN